MASCIHPDCHCKAYEDPKTSKGTLLQLYRGCRGCGHVASEHRQLTAVDKLLQKEVSMAASNKCTHHIPMADIPRSPVFGPHDPIPIPSEDAPDVESGAPCKCPGFSLPSMVSLWQKFRTFSMSDTLAALPTLTCSFCQHPFQSHKAPKPPTVPPLISPSLLQCPQLVLQSSAKLPCTPLSPGCVQVIAPHPLGEAADVCITFVALVKSVEGGLSVLIHSKHLVDESGGLEMKNAASTIASGQLPLEKGTGERAQAGNGCMDTRGDTATAQSEPTATGPIRKKRRVSSSSTAEPPRRSARLAALSASDSDQLPKSSVAERKPKSKSKRKGPKPTVLSFPEPSPPATEMLWGSLGHNSCSPVTGAAKEGVATFLTSLERRESFSEYNLPNELSIGDNIHHMAVTCLSVAPPTHQTKWLLALAGSDKSLSVTVVGSEPDCWVHQLDPPTGSVSCLCWDERVMTARCSHTHLCVGTKSGSLLLCRVALEPRLECSLLKSQKHTSAQISAACWSPNSRFLAAGSLFGEVLLFSVAEGYQLSHVQTLQCAGSSLTVMAWSADSSILAVGGSDDCVQVLHCSTLSTVGTIRSGRSKKPVNTLLEYFAVDKTDKFYHSHSLRGHQSFVAGLAVPHPSTVISVGWDGQVLFWQETDNSSCAHQNKKDLPYVDSEPLGGFKLGPLPTVEFLPIVLKNILNCVLVVLLVDRKGSVTIASYVQQ